MTIAEANDMADVVQKVRSWPAGMRIALARCLLETLERAPPAEGPAGLPRGPSAAEVAAMFKADKPAPDDATVKQGIDDYRLEKYGR